MRFSKTEKPVLPFAVSFHESHKQTDFNKRPFLPK